MNIRRLSTTRIGFRRGSYLRKFMYDFVELFAPHLNREVVSTARAIRSATARDSLFVDVELPHRRFSHADAVLP